DSGSTTSCARIWRAAAARLLAAGAPRNSGLGCSRSWKTSLAARHAHEWRREMLSSIVAAVRFVVLCVQKAGDLLGAPRAALVVGDEPATAGEREDVLARMHFYAPGLADIAAFSTRCTPRDIVSTRPILFRGRVSRFRDLLRRIRANTFDVRSMNPLEG